MTELFKMTQFRDLNENSEITKELNELRNNDNKYGNYHKIIIHFHTPASHDYKYRYICKGKMEEKSYTAITEEKIIEIARERDLFRGEIFNIDELRKMSKKNELFFDLRELIAYLMIADTLLVKQIEVAVITDHNTIEGYKKLDSALKMLRKKHRENKVMIPTLLLGIEISCGDSLHVVGILDESKKIEKFLKDNIESNKLGTFLPAWEVIERFRAYGYIAYVAHINTAEINGVSGAYKKKIFSKENIRVVGVSKLESMAMWLNKIQKDKKIQNTTILYDEDSHNLDDLGEKFFYIKGQKLDFNMFQNAIEDADIAIKYTTPKLPSIFVKSISIEGSGFLSMEEKNFTAAFSTSLNCIIGGRGSGKSTLLNCISFILSQKVDSVAQLKNICKQGKIALCISVNSEDYFIIFNPVTDKIPDESFMHGYIYGEEYIYQYRESLETKIDNDELKRVTQEKIQIFTIRGEKIYRLSDNAKFFKRTFKSAYSINQLVNDSNNDKIQQFILQQLSTSTMMLPKFKKRNIKNDAQLKQQYDRLNDNLKNHGTKVKGIIKSINKEVKNVQISYKQRSINSIHFDWLKSVDPNLFKTNRNWFKGYNLNLDSLISFFSIATNKFGVIPVYLKFSQKKWDDLIPILQNTMVPLGISDIETDIQQVNSENIGKILEEIGNQIIKLQKRKIYNMIDEFYQESDQFDLNFDINSYDQMNKKSNFKSISEISLGQKVVCLLDFIFLFGFFTEDETPLLLDQPEDNLDSRYVYNHLVSALRKQKDTRQVLIVTHNSTIVTNSKPEQVLTMVSDNVHGWIENGGYPTEKDVISDIITTLEGGIDSFKHKQFIYRSALE